MSSTLFQVPRIITQDHDLSIKINNSLQMENICYHGLKSMFSSKILTIRLEI